MNDFATYQLNEIIEIIGGGTPKRDNPSFWGGDIPWLSVVDFNNDKRYVASTVERITQQGLVGSSTKLLNTGDIIISARGTVGCLAQLSMPMAFNQSCYGLRGKNNVIINDYLYYLLKIKVRELKQKTHGAVFDTITKETFSHINVNIPISINVQKKIAKVLSTLDDKIHLNDQLNQTLESIAQAIFKSWFIDFDPVRAKITAKQTGQDPEFAAMCAISGKSEAELEQMAKEDFAELQATAALFPDELIESELWEVPKGWMKCSLSKMINLIGGGTPKRSEPDYWNGNIYWFSVKDVPKESDTFVIRTEERITELGLNKSSTKLLPIGTTIITARGTVGKIALVGHEMAMNQSCYGIQGIDSIKRFMTYYLIKNAVEVLKKNTHGAVFDTITQSTFETVVSIKPCIEIIDLFERKIESIMNKIKSNLYQNHSLIEIRDSLLPKLLSGEVDVSDLQGEVT